MKVDWKHNDKTQRFQPVLTQKVDLAAARRRVKAHENWEKAQTEWKRKMMCQAIGIGVKGATFVAHKIHAEVCKRMEKK
jgi:hypothetical protein